MTRLIAAVAAVAGVLRVGAACGGEAITRTPVLSEWRDLFGPLGSISLASWLAAFDFGGISRC